MVFAAASLRGALDEVLNDWQAQSGQQVLVSYGGSSALARQIMAGAPADLFLSANTPWMQTLVQDGILSPDAPRMLLGNRLVLIGPAGAAPARIGPDLPARLGDGPLAIALPTAVPAGIYARAALEDAGLWAALEGRSAQTDNVRAALRLVALGAAPLGMVYATDTRAEPRVVVLDQVDPASHPPIRYPVASLTARAADLMRYLSSPEAMAVFTSHGFLEVAP